MAKLSLALLFFAAFRFADWAFPGSSPSRLAFIFVSSFSIRSKFVAGGTVAVDGRRQGLLERNLQSAPSSIRTNGRITMRDASASYWFQVGDRVEVVEDVLKAGVNLRGKCGTVKETWEKCNVDPHCCCSEQVDTGLAVRVAFGATDDDDDGDGGFLHYFAEDELIKVTESADAAQPSPSAEQIPFAGMSCVAFKLEQLGSSKPRGIASFDPSKPSTTDQQ